MITLFCGDVFAAILRRYFICAPTMMIKREVLDRLGGYDENLAKEDFDFWVSQADFGHINILISFVEEAQMERFNVCQWYLHHYNEQWSLFIKLVSKHFT